MAYCSAAGARVYAKLLDGVADADFSAMISDIDGEIDDRLRNTVTVPVSPVPTILAVAANMILAGQMLASRLSAAAPQESELAQDLIARGWQKVADIEANPALLGVDPVTGTYSSERRDRVRYFLPRSAPVFGYQGWADMPEPVAEDDPQRGA